MDKETEKELLLREKLDHLISLMTHQPKSMQEYLKAVDEEISGFVCYFDVAKIVCDAHIAGNALVPNGENGTISMYESGDPYDEQNKLVLNNELEKGGHIRFTIYPRMGHVFSENEKKWLLKLEELLYISGTKARLGILCNRAINYDLMTQMPNINYFFSRIGMLIAKRQISEYCAFFFNCKNFKYVNTACGYENGGRVLISYAHRLRDFCTGDEVAARLGGDNFAALIRKENRDEFLKLLSGAEIPCFVNGEEKKFLISAVSGVYEIKDAKNVGEVMMPVSFAFQAAKQVLHKDFVFYDDNVKKQILKAQEILTILRDCISAGEFKAFLQPKVDMKTGRIYGAEALVRWFHEGNMLPPAAFIPPLEKNGNICELDFEMLRQVCAKIREWLDQKKEAPVISINFSRWHLKDAHFIDKIEKIVDEYGVPHKYIEIELTETADVESFNSMNRLFLALKEKKFTTAIDDFGTGYSSLNMLVKSKVDIIKIDKSFVDDVGKKEAESERKLLQHIVNIAKDLDKDVIAEGIETEDQSKWLQKMGCFMAQGFYYYKPMPMEEFEKLI